MSKSITDQILHYQRDIDRCPENSERMIRCIQRLGTLPVTVQHLQETGIGKSVNALRKYGGEVAEAAKSLVWKWKTMVIVEEQNVQSDGYGSADDDATDESVEQNRKEKSLKKENETRRSDSVRQTNDKKSSHSGDRKRHSDSVNDHRKKKEHDRVESRREGKDHRHRSSKLESPREHASRSKRKKVSDSEDDDMAVSSKRRRRKSHHSSQNSDKESSKGSCSDENSGDSDVDEPCYSKKIIKTEPVSSDEEKSSADDLHEDENNSESENMSRSSASDSDDKESERAASANSSLHRSEVSEAEDNVESSDDEPVKVKKEPGSSSTKNESSSCKYSDQLNSSSSSKHRSKDSDRKHSTSRNHESSSSNRHSSNNSSKSRHNKRGENGSSHSSHVSSDRHSKPKSDNKNRMTHSNGNPSSDRSKSRDDRRDKNGIKGKDDRSRKSSSSSSHKDKSSRSDSHSRSKSIASSKSVVKDKSVIIEVKKEKNLEDSSERSSKKDLQKELLKKSSSSPNDSIKREDSPAKFNPNNVKIKVEKTTENEEGIHSGSGASFGDALLVMTAPVKKKKKSIDTNQMSRKSDTSHTSSSSSNKDRGKSSSKTKESRKMSSPSTRPLSNSSSPFLSNNETDLLSTNVRLEPLDVDLAATLPEISPNYRPLPCHSPPPDRNLIKNIKGLTQEEALSSILSTKGQRMKVFSGNRLSGVTKIPSLFTLCVHVLQENIEALEYTGGVPYDLLKPVLERATSEQLYQLEHHNPYLIGDTDELWEFHCKKDFRGQSRDEMESWRDLYLRCFDERERKFKALTENITQKKIIESIPIKKTKLAYVDSVVKPPRNIARKQAKFGTSSAVKHDLVAKAMIGGHSSSGEIAKAVVPPPPQSASRANTNPTLLKKKKAPLMAKTLQFMKGNRRKW